VNDKLDEEEHIPKLQYIRLNNASMEKAWWPADNFTSLALAAWQSWARLPQKKFKWLLEFLKTSQNPVPMNKLDLSFRPQHVPSWASLVAIAERLPKCPTTKVSCNKVVQTYDGPSKDKMSKLSFLQKFSDVSLLIPT
jgi:hypothetical protein